MTIQSYNITDNINTPILYTDGSNKKVLVTNILPNNTFLGLDNNVKVLGQNIILKNIKAFSKLPSLNPAPIPDLTIDDSDTDKLIKLLDNEYHSQRYQLNVYLGAINLTETEYTRIGAISLLNQQGYQFNYYDLLNLIDGNFEIGNNSCLAVSISDQGVGLLKSGDILNITGYYVREIIVDVPSPVTVVSGNSGNNNNGSNTTVTYENITDSQWLNITDSQWINF